MDVLPKRNVLIEDSPLFRRVKPVLLDIACRGLTKTSRKRIVTVTIASLLMSPFGWILDVLTRGLHVALVVTLWWFFREEVSVTGLSEGTFLALAVVVIFYESVYSELVDILLHLLVLVTGGSIVDWLCSGYLANSAGRQHLFANDKVIASIAVLIAAMPATYRARYDSFMNLYLESNDSSSEAALETLLDEYVPGDIED